VVGSCEGVMVACMPSMYCHAAFMWANHGVSSVGSGRSCSHKPWQLQAFDNGACIACKPEAEASSHGLGPNMRCGWCLAGSRLRT
jgi:hypothetical protein